MKSDRVRDVVFDLGGVVVEWSPKRILSRFALDPATEEAIRDALFESGLWLDFDRGAIGTAELGDEVTRRSRCDSELVAEIIASVPSSLLPFDATVRLLEEITESGNRVWYLSNMTAPSLDHLEAQPFFRHFSGGIASCRVGMLKPEREIFARLIAACSITPAESIFIDDTPANVDAALNYGIPAVHFTGADSCRCVLVDLGVLAHEQDR